MSLSQGTSTWWEETIFTKFLCVACAACGHTAVMHQHTRPWVAVNMLCAKNPRNDLQDVRIDRHLYELNAEGIYAHQAKPVPN